MKKRIICVGNRYVPGDDTGLKVYDYLSRSTLPIDVHVIEGGLLGLGLLPFIEDAERVIFVDSVSGFGYQGQIVILDRVTAAKTTNTYYGHSAGLTYLLRVLPTVCDGKIPEISLVGAEGTADEYTIKVMASTCLRIAENGLSGNVSPSGFKYKRQYK